jgi:hypothetical protein
MGRADGDDHRILDTPRFANAGRRRILHAAKRNSRNCMRAERKRNHESPERRIVVEYATAVVSFPMGLATRKGVPMQRIALVLILGLGWFLHEAKQAAAQPIGQRLARVEQVRAGAKKFQFSLQYYGEQNKPDYSLTLQVPAVAQSLPLHPIVRISEEQAKKIIDYLDAEGLLGEDMALTGVPPPPARPRCALTFLADGIPAYKDLGSGMPLLKRLGGLRKVLEGDAARQMDVFLGRLAGHRTEGGKARAVDPVVGPPDARAIDNTDLRAARLQLALREVEYRMAQVKLRQALILAQELEQAVAEQMIPAADLEMTELDLAWANLNVRAAEIKLAQGRLTWEQLGGTPDVVYTKTAAPVFRPVQPPAAIDLITSIRSVLPDGWNIHKVVVGTYPSNRPEGIGTAVFLVSGQNDGDGNKQSADAVVYIMPAGYEDGGENLTNAKAQANPARLIATTDTAKIYLWDNHDPSTVDGWPTLKDDILRALVK